MYFTLISNLKTRFAMETIVSKYVFAGVQHEYNEICLGFHESLVKNGLTLYFTFSSCGFATLTKTFGVPGVKDKRRWKVLE